MKIRALKAFTIRNSETGDLTSIAYGAIAEVSNTVGQSLIEDGIAEAYDDGSNDENFKKAVDKSITSITADMLEGVTNIRNVAFRSCSSLASIEIPNSVTSIGASAFNGCTSLASIEIPNSVTSIGASTFNGCTSLTSVTVLATTPPTLGSTVFPSSSDLKIYVPAESVDVYKAASRWSSYAENIEAIST